MSDANVPQETQRANAAPEAGTQPMRVDRALEQAHKLFVAGHLDKAAQLCTQIVSQRPRLPEAHNLLAAIVHAQGNSAAAIKSMQRAINLNGNNAQFYANLGEMERQRGKLPQALVALRRAVEIGRAHV